MTTTSLSTDLDPTDIAEIVTATMAAVSEHYVFPDVSRQIVDLVADKQRGGGYDDLRAAADLAAAMTTDLQSVNGDLHLRLRFHPDGVVDAQDADAFLTSYTRESETNGHGIAQVRRLSGNVAYLELGPLLFHPQVAGDAIAAAMQLVASADSLIIDLRGCLGGSPETVVMLCSYLFDEETHLTDQLTNDPDDVHQRWTMPWVPGAKVRKQVPVQILTGPVTFSGGEDLAYTLQQSGRASVVGERTRGGAHPREGFTVHSHLEATVPVAYSRHPVSKTNWEGVGVRPDVAVPAADALATALQRAGGDS